jgi:hypothetical protein
MVKTSPSLIMMMVRLPIADTVQPLDRKNGAL